MAKLVPLSEAKGHLSELVRDSDSDEVLLMRHGRPAAVMLSARRWDAVQEELEDLRDRLSVTERDGVVVDFEKVMAELGLNA
jgi:antitoxin StbD